MALVSPSTERMDLSRPMESSPSGVADDEEATLSLENVPVSPDLADRGEQIVSSPSRNSDAEIQSTLRSEEYRQLFRLPPDEVLVQDFNCAFQESILLQGHMYLFVHYVCFYSNIFGFETKKVIPFREITTVKRAKTAGIFPNAIEIFAGGKKYFFASFLSRDEAFKIINDGWLQLGNGSLTNSEVQDTSSETSSPQNEPVVLDKVNSSQHFANSSDSMRSDEVSMNDSELPNSMENDGSVLMVDILEENVKQDEKMVTDAGPSSSSSTLMWKIENVEAPQVPEGFTKTAETKFPVKVEEIFRLFFSDDGVDFVESYHTKCGDKEFRCSSWQPHDEFGYTRDISFQHPIKIYFGAKFGSCQEVQKFRVYKNSHMVVETSQEVSDVPYGDYFRVEGLWEVESDGNESSDGCIMRVYVNVAFSKKTVWKGKIVQSTLEECRETFETWISMAHDVLKQKDLERQTDSPSAASTVDVLPGKEMNTVEPSERLCDSNSQIRTLHTSDPINHNQQIENRLLGSSISISSVGSLFRESVTGLCSFLQSQNRISLILVVAFAVIFLMQVSIVVLLNRPQHIHVSTPPEYMGGNNGRAGERTAQSAAWLEKRMHYLKDEMLMVEARLERMWHEHAALKAQLKDLEQLSKPQ